MLWWRFGLAGENPVKATMAHCLSFGVRTRAGRRAAITALQGAGLVAVELSSTKAPRVTILDAGKPVLPRTTKASRRQSNSCPPQEETTQLLHDPHPPPEPVAVPAYVRLGLAWKVRRRVHVGEWPRRSSVFFMFSFVFSLVF